MKLILSDKNLNVILPNNTKFIDLSSLKISKLHRLFLAAGRRPPGKCLIRDDAVKVYPYIAKCSSVLYVSRIRYGGYDTVMKTMLERAIPIQQAFIRLLHGETHHIQRDVAPKNATIIGYGNIDRKEKEIFQELVGRNAQNMNFQHYQNPIYR